MQQKMIVACSQAILDKLTNNLSLINIIDEVQTSVIPGVISELFVVGTFERAQNEPQTPAGTVKIKHNDVEVAAVPFNVDFQGQMRSRSIVSLSGVPINVGKLSFTMCVDAVEYSTWNIDVTAVPQVNPAGGGAA